MAKSIHITLALFVSLCSIVFARVLSRSSLSKDIARIPEGHSIIREPLPRITDLPWQISVKTTGPPNFTFDPPVSQRSDLDLAFIMDSTGSMSPYIKNVRRHILDLVDAIVASSSTNLRLALIEYRDHEPQDRTFVTRKHDFTSSASTMKSWLKKARASGGGDGPEAVAEAMYEATTLSWRSDAAKISVLISDAPPHGFVPYLDRSFPEGSPNGHDPMDLARKLVKEEIVLYTVGCEPSIMPYKDFFMALAYLTGGQYIPLSVPHFLTEAIIGGAKEELSLKRFVSDVQKEIGKATSSGVTVDEQQIAQSVFAKLKSEGAKSTQLLRNNKPLESASEEAKTIAASNTMAGVRKVFREGERSGMTGEIFSMRGPAMFPASDMRRRRKPHSTRRRPTHDMMSEIEELPSSIGRYESSLGSHAMSAESRPVLPRRKKPGSDESFSTVEKEVSLDQISRLVKQATAKLGA